MSSPYVPVPGAAPYRVQRAPNAWSWSSVLPVVVRGVIAILILLMAQLVLATILHEVPPLGLAIIFVGPYAPWFVVLPLAGAVLAWIAWRIWPGRFGVTIIVIALLTALGGGVITGRMIHSVQSAGADISVRGLLTLAPMNAATPDDRRVYLEHDGKPLSIDIYRPPPSTTKAPVLLYIHGGGWTKGSPSARSADMQWFADQGYLVLGVAYTLSTSTKHLWDVTQGQIGCSLSWAGEHAAEYGGDVSRFSLLGDSSGGTLAINTAYLQTAGELPSACGGKAPKVAALSVVYPGVDLKAIHDLTIAGAGYTTKYIGGTPKQFPERYAAASSMNKIRAGAPPTFILTGQVDHIVPPSSVVRFASRIREAGIESKLVRVPYASHGFDGISGNIGNKAYRQLTIKWLDKHGQKA